MPLVVKKKKKRKIQEFNIAAHLLWMFLPLSKIAHTVLFSVSRRLEAGFLDS
jgi:hypothetical protein